ncbi:MAG: hypothetical protein ACR2GX_05990 [Candidatus Dormibacteria bacterium]
MSVARAVLHEVIGLFVADWPQTILVLATLVCSWWLTQHAPGFPVGFLLAGVLVLELIGGSLVEAGERSRPG